MKINYPNSAMNNESSEPRTIHIYPQAFCNQHCSHCYTSSGPFHKEAGISPEKYFPFLKYAFKKGFNTISISGGEPFLYKGLESLVFASKEIGYQVRATTNGTVLNDKKIKRLLPLIDYVEVSLDGTPELHNEIRNDQEAFAQLEKGVEILKKYVERFGFTHTLTSKSWDSLLWLTEFVSRNGAAKMTIHPLEISGRATFEMRNLEVDQLTLHKVFYIQNYLQNKYKHNLELQMNVVHKSYLELHPEIVYVYSNVKNYADLTLANAFKNISIDQHGDILPVGYGFSPQFVISNLEFFDPGFDVFREYMIDNGSQLKKLFMQSYWNMVNHKSKDYFNLRETLIKDSWETKAFEFV